MKEGKGFRTSFVMIHKPATLSLPRAINLAEVALNKQWRYKSSKQYGLRAG